MERRVAKAKAVLKGKRDRRVEIREKLEYYKCVTVTHGYYIYCIYVYINPFILLLAKVSEA